MWKEREPEYARRKAQAAAAAPAAGADGRRKGGRVRHGCAAASEAALAAEPTPELVDAVTLRRRSRRRRHGARSGDSGAVRGRMAGPR